MLPFILWTDSLLQLISTQLSGISSSWDKGLPGILFTPKGNAVTLPSTVHIWHMWMWSSAPGDKYIQIWCFVLYRRSLPTSCCTESRVGKRSGLRQQASCQLSLQPKSHPPPHVRRDPGWTSQKAKRPCSLLRLTQFCQAKSKPNFTYPCASNLLVVPRWSVISLHGSRKQVWKQFEPKGNWSVHDVRTKATWWKAGILPAQAKRLLYLCIIVYLCLLT